MDDPLTAPRIQRLSADLANRIAAGEVVERPASIVKELVENSLDAGADRIEVQVGRGGIDWIRVTDNGRGIHPDDLPLALERHATSKIRNQSDLDAIVTLGFRGEALPSIASVARLRLVSRATGRQQARQLEVQADGRVGTGPAAHPPGTSVEVRGLFRTLPARRKFLRSERTEYLHILELVKRLALGRPQVGLRLLHNDRLVLNCPAVESAAAGRRLERVLGAAFVGNAHYIDLARDGIRLHGWLGRVEAARNQSDQQYCYLNGRLIRDRQVNHAIRIGYGDDVPVGRYPVFVLFLEMDPGQADVNVHPTKHEVRFRRVRDVHDFLAAAVREGLGYANAGSLPRRAEDAGSAVSEAKPGYRGRAAVEEPAAAAAWTGFGRPVAELNHRFVITERGGEHVLVDLQSLRQVYLRHRLEQERAAGKLRRRPLLVPVDVALDEVQLAALDRSSAQLDLLGLETARTAPGRIGVRTVPMLLESADIAALVSEAAGLLVRQPGGAEAMEPLAALLLAHAAAAASGQPPAAELDAYARALQGAGVNLSVRHRTGMWRTLDRNDLMSLLGGHG